MVILFVHYKLMHRIRKSIYILVRNETEMIRISWYVGYYYYVFRHFM